MTYTGTITDIFADQYATFVVVDIQNRDKKLAIRCWDKARKAEVEQLQVGDVIQVTGECSSRAGKEPRRWFTNYEATAIKKLELQGAKAKDRVVGADDLDEPAF